MILVYSGRNSLPKRAPKQSTSRYALRSLISSALRLSFPLRLLHLPPAVLSTAMEPFPEHTPKQASYKEKATTEWNVDDLVGWIKEKRPHLLDIDESEKLRTAEISGKVFLACAGDKEFFKNDCELPPGTAVVLANLSRELAKEGSKLLSFMSCTPRRQQANNVTGNRQQAEDVEMSAAADSAGKSTDHAPLLFSLYQSIL